MEQFCTDEFWDWNLTWGNDRAYPEFTECFQNTALQCLGSVWLWLSVPVYVYILLRHYRSEPLPHSWLSTARQSILVLQLSVRLLQLKAVTADIDHNGGSYWSARVVGPVAEGLTMALVVAVMELERRKRFVTSGVLSVFWLLTSLSAVTLVYSEIIKHGYQSASSEMSLLKAWLGFAVCQLALCFYTEQLPKGKGKKKDCPLTQASFFSRCIYSWMSGFMKLGYDRPLEAKDFSKLLPSEQSETVIAQFEEAWKQQEDKLRAKQQDKSESNPKLKVSLFKVLVKTFGTNLIGSNCLKVVSSVADLAQPALLGALIGLAEDSSIPTWKGFVYMAGFLFFLAIECTTINYMHHLSNGTALRLRACITNAIFKKSLRMTNKARSDSTVGEIVNLMSTDLESMKHWMAYFWVVWSVPVYTVCCFVLLYRLIGVGALAGLAVIVVVMPFNAYLAKVGHVYHKDRMDRKDDRIKLLTEIFNGIKILKLYAWELAFGEKIKDMREKELAILRKHRLVGLAGTFSFCIAPFLMAIVSFATYVHVNEDHVLTAQTAFSALTVLYMMTGSFNALPHIVTHFMKALTGLNRIDNFLNKDDIDPQNVSHGTSDDAISIKDGTFTWDSKIGPVLKDINMTVPKGGLVAVVGRVGKGKSSLLSAILGEVEKNNGAVNVDGSLSYVPQQAWIQNDTLQNNILFGKRLNPKTYRAVTDACALVKDLEILPGKDQTEIGEKGINLSGGQKQRISMARAVYHNADIYLLDDPLSAVDAHVGKHIFEHVIGSKGFLRNKTRVLVTHGLTWLQEVDKIFVMDKGGIAEAGSYKELMCQKGAFANFIREYKPDLPLNEDGSDVEDCQMQIDHSANPYSSEQLFQLLQLQQLDAETATTKYETIISESGYVSEDKSSGDESSCSEPEQELTEEQKHFRRSISRALSHESKELVDDDKDDEDKDDEDFIKESKEKGKFIDDEEVEVGKVQMKYVIPYIKALGKPSVIFMFIFFACFKVCEVAQSIWIKEWTNNDDLKNFSSMPEDSDERQEVNSYYIWVYASIGLFQGTCLIIHETILAFAIVRAAAKLHEVMLVNVLRGRMSFFDTTPVGRIVNRFSHDMDPLDGAVSGQIEWFLHVAFGTCSVFAVIMYSIPNFIVMVVPVTVLYLHMQKYFVPARRQISRLESKTRSPIASHFSESLNGTSTIRAYGCQARFAHESAKKVDKYQEIQFHNASIDRWMCIRLDMLMLLCFFFTVSFALSERYYISGAVIGLLMNYSLRMNGNLQGLIRVSGEIERSIVSVERIGQYSSRETEADLHTTTKPPAEWPDQGKVELKNYSLRYRPDTDLVLKGIDVSVRKGEKVGIVGRTGAGKSSLTIGLFRLVEPATGSVYIDGYDVKDVGLFDLRSNLTILPQEPVLFSGTLRTNLDPMNVHSDETIYNALEHAHLKDFVTSLPDKLKYECGEGGQNLSVGQRQLICLARSLLKKSKLLVLDEATAAVDLQTDELIQNTIKKEFKECTVLTIAHRLNTIIDYDRILVLDHGEVKEFDSPKKLLQDKNSMFYSMAKDANLVC